MKVLVMILVIGQLGQLMSGAPAPAPAPAPVQTPAWTKTRAPPAPEGPAYVDSQQTSVVFKPAGTYSSRTYFLNVRIPMHLKPTFDAIDTFVWALRKSPRASIYEEVSRHIKKQAASSTNLVKDQLRGLLSTLPQYPVTPNQVSKRQLGLLLGIGGNVMAGAETLQIQQMDKRIAKEDEELVFLKDISHLQENHMKNLELKLGWQDNLFKDVIQNQPATYLSSYTTVQRELESMASMATSVISHAQLHRLAPGVYSAEALEAVVQYTQDLARTHEMENFIHHTSDLYQLETSFLYNPSNLTFSTILHIPLVKKEHLLHMFKYIPLPLNTDLTSGHSLMPDVGSQDIIAVQGQEGQEVYKILSDSDLHKCLRLSNTHFCKGNNVVNINTKATCLSSIFFGHHDSARQQCKFRITPTKEAVFETAHNEFIVYTNQTMKIQEVCPTTKNSSRLVHNGDILKVLPGCKIQTLEHLLVADLEESFEVEDKQDIKSWAWSVGNLFPNITGSQFDLALERLNSMGFHNIDTADLLHQLDIISAQPDPKFFSWGYYACGAILLVVALILIVSIYLRCKSQSCKPKEPRACTASGAPFKEFLNLHLAKLPVSKIPSDQCVSRQT